MFQYEVMTEKDAMAERFQLIKEGEYDAMVSHSVDKRSSTGNPMMEMTLTIYNANGSTHEIRDYLVFTKTMMWKVIGFCQAANLMEIYEAGKLCSKEVKNCHVRAKVGLESGKEIPEDKLNGKPLGSKYPDKNKIEHYVKIMDENNLNKKNLKKEEADSFVDDDLPF